MNWKDLATFSDFRELEFDSIRDYHYSALAYQSFFLFFLPLPTGYQFLGDPKVSRFGQ